MRWSIQHLLAATAVVAFAVSFPPASLLLAEAVVLFGLALKASREVRQSSGGSRREPVVVAVTCFVLSGTAAGVALWGMW